MLWHAPVSPETFAHAYETSAISDAADIVRVVAIIRIGSFVEYRSDGSLGGQPTGRDLQALDAWHQVVGYPYWTRIYANAFVGLSTWYAHQSVQRALSAMSPVLVNTKTMSRYSWLSLCEMSGLASVPLPDFRPALRPATGSSVLPARTIARRSATPNPSVPASGRRFTPECEGWRWDERANYGTGGWIR